MKKPLCILLILLLTAALLTGCGESAPSEVKTLHIYCFSAGKADAFLLYTDASAVLIDTGESGFGKTIAAKCEELDITRLDCLIITHFDKDHVGGAKKVLEELAVDRVLQSNCPKDSSEYEKYVKQLSESDITAETVTDQLCFTLDGVTYTVDPPRQQTYDDSGSNNSSLIVATDHGECRCLFTGDAEDARLSEYLETDPGHFDLVKMPHHGRWQDTLRDLIAQTAPDYAVITSSDDEREDDSTAALLRDNGVGVFLTREHPVSVTDDGKQLTVTYE